MSAEAAHHFLTLIGAIAGRKIIRATDSDASYSTAAALSQAGAKVTLDDYRTYPPKLLKISVFSQSGLSNPPTVGSSFFGVTLND